MNSIEGFTQILRNNVNSGYTKEVFVTYINFAKNEGKFSSLASNYKLSNLNSNELVDICFTGNIDPQYFKRHKEHLKKEKKCLFIFSVLDWQMSSVLTINFFCELIPIEQEKQGNFFKIKILEAASQNKNST